MRLARVLDFPFGNYNAVPGVEYVLTLNCEIERSTPTPENILDLAERGLL